ncbi:leucine-rich repeat domain-containing protein [Candidatus Poribacteria bacterium]|nr:leucine-rich repeat domain-containing protein [Candidatus Poribacteria bacterium]MYA57700.1 leucine-rich repeat domain-containing protein [Candidatus Poribacteria bacterium]
MQVKRVSITVFSVLFSLLLPSLVYAQRNQPEVVSIPDANLATAVREIIGDSITTHTLLDLTGLRVEERGIENLTGLEHARNLRRLHLQRNAISDISPLAGLTQLTELLLSVNNISDVSPLVELKKPPAVYMNQNPLSYDSINTHIPVIQAKGIEIGFDERVPRYLVTISDPTEQGAVNSPFPLRFVVEVQDQRRKPFSGVPVTFGITVGDGTLTAADRRTDATGKATARLKLGRTVGTTVVRVTAAHIQHPDL